MQLCFRTIAQSRIDQNQPVRALSSTRFPAGVDRAGSVSHDSSQPNIHHPRVTQEGHARFLGSVHALLSLAEARVLHLHGQIKLFPVTSDLWEKRGTTCCPVD